MRVRSDLGWVPCWDASFRGYAINFIKKNHWRCEQLHDFDDLLQDAYLTFRRVKAAYPSITKPKHFMALFKVALNNEMIDRARYKRDKNQAEIVVDDELKQLILDRIGSYANEGYLRALVAEMPPETKLFLEAMNNPKLLELIRKKHKQSKLSRLLDLPKRENLNATVRRVLGLPRGTDLLGPLRKALK